MATNNEEIIERKEKSPVATSCLVIAVIALLGAIALQISELTEIRNQYTSGEKLANEVKRVDPAILDMKNRVEAIITAPLSDEAGVKRVEDATARSAEIKKAAKAEQENSARGAGAGSEESPEETPAEPVESPEETPAEPVESPEETPAEPVESPEETPAEPVESPEEAPAEPAKEDSDEPEDPLEDL